MRLNHLHLLAINAAAFIGMAVAQDEGNDPTINVCIHPQACFQNNGDDAITYCITSPWSLSYPGQLRKNIAHTDGIKSVPYNSPLFDRCGWNQGSDGISSKHVARGTIYYKPANASLDFRPPEFPADVAPAVYAMQHTYPLTEIMLILLFTVILPIGVTLSVCMSGCLRAVFGHVTGSWQRRAARRRENREMRANTRTHAFRTTLRSGASRDSGSRGSSEPAYWDAQEKV